MKEKIIFFTRIPSLGSGKRRLLGFLSDEDILKLSTHLTKKNYEEIKKSDVETIIYYSGDIDNSNIKFKEAKVEQKGESLGDKMMNAFKSQGEDAKTLLIGSDLANLEVNLIKECFRKLDKVDVVITASEDGGYGIIGMKKPYDLFTGITYSTSNVLKDTINRIENLKLTYALVGEIYDIDEKEDLIRYIAENKEISPLGNGEYNLNYKIQDGDSTKVFRINMKSQMNLGDSQIEYEYNALKELEGTGVTPRVYSFKKPSDIFPYGSLYMEYLKGRPLSYDTDFEIAAYLLSTVHNHKIRGNSSLIKSEKPFKVMYEEFLSMYSHYKSFDKKDLVTEKYIDKFMKIAKNMGLNDQIERACIINTELNNRNFIINEEGKSYIIDWEKPLIGECEQDIAHFLVPTTTNWKTDKILGREDVNHFISLYEKYRKINRSKLDKYLVFNTLRGVTWCSMAKCEYENQRFLSCDETLEKINKFLSKEFLEFLYKNFYEVYDEGNI